MAIKPKKGLGLLSKVILFSLIPAYFIIGALIYFYYRDLREGITQKYIEDALSTASMIQELTSNPDFFQSPTRSAQFLDEMIRTNPNFLRISVYAGGDGQVKAIASTDPDQVGRAVEPRDAAPLQTGKPVVEETMEEGLPLLEVIAPYFDGGKPVAAIGIYTSLIPRDVLVAHLSKEILWFIIPGFALILLAVFYVVYRVLLKRIRLLSKGTDVLAHGELGHRLPVLGKDELSRLTDSFNTMASSLQSLVEQEKIKVRQSGILFESAKHFSTEVSLDALMERLVEYPRRLIPSEVSALYLLDSETGKIIHFKHAGVDLSQYPLREQPQGRGLLGVFLIDGRPVRLEDIRQDPRFESLPPGHIPIRNYLGVPIMAQDKVIGGMAVANKLDGTAYTREEENLLTTLAFQASMAIERTRLFEETQRLAITDGLTDLYNHRMFQSQLEDEINRAKRYNRNLALLVADLDHFKSINDIYGHSAGDHVLHSVGEIIQKCVRQIDSPARYGGEEFAIILPETSAEGARVVAERLRMKVFGHPFVLSGGQQIFLSISVGVACFPSDAITREDLIEAADKALYFSKDAGRNTVTLFSEMSTVEAHRLAAFKRMGLSVEERSPYILGHSEGMVKHALMLGRIANLPQEKLESLRIAGLLHNIGLINIPESILNKPGPLNHEERRIIQAHPTLAEMMLQNEPHLNGVLAAILYHHERWDGHGYPRGLRGEEIPPLARILSIAEAYQAMTSDRPYRRRLSKEEAIEELRHNAGTQFNPQLVEAFIELLTRKEEAKR